MTEAYEKGSDGTSNSAGESLEVTYQAQAAIGATGTRTANASSNANAGNAHTLAFKSALASLSD